MKNILITGASGNIGIEMIRGLGAIDSDHRIIAADFNTDHAEDSLAGFRLAEIRKLDFADPSTFNSALDGVDLVFLLRPPQLADVPNTLPPLWKPCRPETSIRSFFFRSREWKTRREFLTIKSKN